VTSPGIDQTLARLRRAGKEGAVFHAVGLGGVTMANWIADGVFDGVLDFTPHEITRILFGKERAEGIDRFHRAAEQGIPQLIVPGGLNLHCFGPIGTVDPALLQRPHYRHSAAFTHVRLSTDEMAACAAFLCDALNRTSASTLVVVPLRGFSSEDRAGGAIDAPELRQLFLNEMRAGLGDAGRVVAVDAHINDAAFADVTAERYLGLVGGRA
jgi:uncharacterized protein (UPF0261 family)